MTIDHICLRVPEEKFQQCLEFYLASLKPRGYTLRHQFGDYVVGLGSPTEDLEEYKRADFWLVGSKAPGENSTHIAFSCSDRATVDAFHAAGIAAGSKDNGAPGLRAFYHSNYYGAFLLDPVGNNIEAVYHGRS